MSTSTPAGLIREARVDKSRLRSPSVKTVQKSGSFNLTYEGLDTSHDLGGGNYLFRTWEADQEIEVRARVSNTTSSNAEKHAAQEGKDYRALSLIDALDYQEKVASEHGRRSQVLLFDVFRRQQAGVRVIGFRERIHRAVEALLTREHREVDIELLARRFCFAFFRTRRLLQVEPP